MEDPPKELWPWHPDIDGKNKNLVPSRPPLNERVVTSAHVCPPSPFSISEGRAAEGSSLVQSSSITVTAQTYPSDIAKKALEELGEIDSEYWNSHEFVKYLQLCEQKGFRVKGYDTKKGKIVSFGLEYNNRWGKARRKELGEKLKRLEYWFELQEDRPVTMITLTSYHKGLSISSAWFELNKSRDKLRKLIFKYFGPVDYFWVVEPHKSGYVHYHMAVFADVDNETKDKKGRGIEDKFRDLWSKKYKTGNHTYGLDFAQKKDESKINHLKNYLQKYLSKGFLLDTWSPGMLKFNAAMWDTGFRMYGASKNIREIMNIKNDKSCQTVWLETKIQEPAKTPGGGIRIDVFGNEIILPGGEEYEEERVVWDRQYIPDWIDEPLWYGNGRQIPSDLNYEENQKQGIRLYDWGRGHVLPLIYEVKSWRDAQDVNITSGELHRLDGSKRVPSMQETNQKNVNGLRQRKKEEDPYEQYNKEYGEKYSSAPAGMQQGNRSKYRDQWGAK